MSTSNRTIGEIQTEFLVRYQGNTSAAFINDTLLKNWIDQAHTRTASYKKWPNTEGRVSTTFASLSTNEDGYLVGEFPEGWKSDSIRMLTIGGKKVQKVNFYQLQKYLEDNSSTQDRVYSDFGRRIYVNPRIDLSGTVTMWGQYTPALDTTDTSAVTVFSDSDIEANEAIIEFMMAFAFDREKKPAMSKVHYDRAKEILDLVWERVGAEQFGYHSTDSDGMFTRIDIVDGSRFDDSFKRDQF